MNAPPPCSPHDAPRPGELVEAVRTFVEQEVAPVVEGQTAFHLRVALNALAIVERQLALGPAQEAAHGARLRRLGCDDDAELARAIRRGALAERHPEVVEALRQAVWDKVMVVNPRYVGTARHALDRTPEPPIAW